MTNKRDFWPYEVACVEVQKHGFKSRNDYQWWHKRHKPKHLPRWPNRAYIKEWVSWNYWLGNQNVFKGKDEKHLRPFWEAVKYAQAVAAKHNLNTMKDWVEYAAGGKNIPNDIPCRPDVEYMAEFKGNGWGVWLGKDIRGKLIAAANNVALLAICTFKSLHIPGNMILMLYANGGMSELKETMSQRVDIQVQRLYLWDSACKPRVDKLLSEIATPQDGANKYLCRDYNALIFELDNMLDWYKP